MKTVGDGTPLVLPPSLLAEVEAAADAERRPVSDVLRDLVQLGLDERRGLKLPAHVRERAEALGLTAGAVPRRLVRKVSQMSAAELEAIGNTEMDARHDHLDAELK